MAGVIELHINGSAHVVNAESGQSLLEVLRDDLGLTGSKYGCGEGRCGACTVIVDGQSVRSCLAQAEQCAGKQVTTIEGLEQDGKLHPLQQAFLDAGAMQCGYCTCGMIIGGVVLLAKNAAPSTAEIAQALEGHICRCGTYARIVSAVQRAAEIVKVLHGPALPS